METDLLAAEIKPLETKPLEIKPLLIRSTGGSRGIHAPETDQM